MISGGVVWIKTTGISTAICTAESPRQIAGRISIFDPGWRVEVMGVYLFIAI